MRAEEVVDFLNDYARAYDMPVSMHTVVHDVRHRQGEFTVATSRGTFRSRNVVIATPATLIALLRAVAYGWRQEQVAENAQQISDLGRQVHDRLTTLISRLAGMGAQLNKTVKAYNETVASLEARVLPAVRRFDELGVPSRKGRLDPQRVESREQLEAKFIALTAVKA